MSKHKKTSTPQEIPPPDNHPEIEREIDPETPVIPQEEPDLVPDDNPFENPPPYEIPEPGEGP